MAANDLLHPQSRFCLSRRGYPIIGPAPHMSASAVRLPQAGSVVVANPPTHASPRNHVRSGRIERAG
jgi:hypothetical protein